MFTIRIGGIEVTCGSVADTAALIAALGERGAARLPSAAEVERAADTRPGPPSPAAPEPFVARAGPPPRVPQRNPRGRTWTEEQVRALHARFLKGARIEDLAAEGGKTGEALRHNFKGLGLATRFARPNPVAAASPEAARASRAVNREKQDWPAAPGHECAYVDGKCLGCDRPRMGLAPDVDPYRKAG